MRALLIQVTTVLVAAFLCGCAATVQRASVGEGSLGIPAGSSKRIVLTVKGNETSAKSPDWEQLRATWRSAMAEAAGKAGVEFAYLDTDTRPAAAPGTWVAIRVNDYRFLSAGARYAFGVMTGNAYMDADAEFIDLVTGRPAGKRSYKTSSTAWEGVFSAMTEKQLQAISTEIVGEVTRR